jgi:lipoprotein-anchoring transpeptidase ErfK/SrfK
MRRQAKPIWRKIMKTAAFALAALLGLAGPSFADTPPLSLVPTFATAPQVMATVSISEQRMNLIVLTGTGDALSYTWKVSTGRSGFETPTGSFQPTWLDINHRSKTYDDTPMPFAVFFSGGYAVHATDAVARLGNPASHGCVRLSPKNAATFYELVAAYGKANTKIVITD